MTGSKSVDSPVDNFKLVVFCDPINHVIATRACVLYFHGYQYTVILILARYTGAVGLSTGAVARTAIRTRRYYGESIEIVCWNFLRL